MRKILWLFLVLFVTGVSDTYGQQTEIYIHNLSDFDSALLLFKDKQYQSAQILFDQVQQQNISIDVNSDCAYYFGICAIHLNQNNADELIERFIKEFPTSSKHNSAYIEVAQYYFEQGKYPQSLEFFNKVDESSLSYEQTEKFIFQKGYAYFNSADKKTAASYFNSIVNSKEYGVQANYYLGFIQYEGDNYQEATKYFKKVEGEDKYSDKLTYFKADMNFKSGDFQKAIDAGIEAMPKSNATEKSELNKIIGESYFNLKQYDKALPYLKEYKGKKNKWSNTDFYQLGYTYYKKNDFENAISQFNKIISGNDSVSQNAYYHLGECYFKTDKKQQALNAFKSATEMSFDKKIQEDANLNYAKLSYELGNSFQSVPDILMGFINKYPTSTAKSDIETLLISSYITSKNYKEALILLEKNNNSENKTAYQKVLFYRGVELFTDGNYQEALKMFTKSSQLQLSEKISLRATFWKGETQYVLDNFTEALQSFKQFEASAESKSTIENKNVAYNIAYAYFKLKEYDLAGDYFQKYVDGNKEDRVRLNDAYLRLGDARFVSAKYWPAMDAYNKAIDMKGIDADYAAFQKAISYGFVGKNDKKIEDFNLFIQRFKSSQYRDDVLIELGNTYVAEGKTDLALATYEQLLKEFKNGSFAAKAILRQGLIYFNEQKGELAIAKFKTVVAAFPKSAEASEAVTSARLVYMDLGKVNEYATWVRTLDFVEISDADLDNDTYEAAEKQFLQNNIKPAISGLSGYLTSFSNGIHVLQANFYLAQSYFSDGKESEAAVNYEFVISKPRNEFTEQSLARLSEIYLKKDDYAKAIPVLQRLETEADFPQNIMYAQANLMRSLYEQKDYSNSVVYADKVLANPKTDNKIKSDAQIIVARAAIQVKDESKAKVAYAKLLTIAKGELAAEALYYEAYFKSKEAKYEDSNLTVQKLAKDYSGYKYFGAKGLVVMAKNYYQLKDNFSATSILESVIKNFKEFDDVVAEAQTELNMIKGEAAKTNSSLTE